MAKAEQQTRDRPADQAAKSAPKDNLPAETKKAHPIVVFKEYAEKRIATLQELPHIDPQQLLSVALTAIQRKADLLKCTPQSLWNACVLAAQDGLLPDGREGAIVPYGENVDGKRAAEIATWMPMIEGLRKKVRNSGEIREWYVEIAYAGDLFRYRKGDDPKLDHEPVPPSQRTQGVPNQGIIAAYSIAVFKDGTKTAPEVMWIEEILSVKAKSKAQKGPWSDPAFFPEMCKKTVARRHYKQLPHATGLDKLIERDDADYDLDRRDEQQIENRNVRRLSSTTAAFDQFAGQTIDHDDPANNRQQGDGEFDDDDADDRGAGQQTGADATKNKDPISSGPQGDQGGTKPEGDGKEAGSANEQPQGDERRWPNGEVPKDADEYTHYVETKIGDFQKADADKIAPWWKSSDENKLRTACGVGQALFVELRDKAANRAADLRK